MDQALIYTVGHSNHSIEYFVELLKTHSINLVIDVRSLAASSYNPQYNKEFLEDHLKSNKISYKHFAEEFGARHTDPDLLDNNGKVDFNLVRKSWNFKNGVERLWKLIEEGKITALMCSESEPLDCHRFSMISVALQKDGFDVKHILKDKSLVSNAELETQLLKKFAKKIQKPNIFEPDITLEDQLTEAYRLKNKEIAYSPYNNQPEEKND